MAWWELFSGQPIRPGTVTLLLSPWKTLEKGWFHPYARRGGLVVSVTSIDILKLSSLSDGKIDDIFIDSKETC